MNKKEDILQKKVEILLRVGKLLHQSLADSNRIDRNLRRVAVFLRIPKENITLHIAYTTIMICVKDGAGNVSTQFIKCKDHAPNMDMIADISELTWSALRDHYSYKKFIERLNEIEKKSLLYSKWLVMVTMALACASFSKLAGSDWAAVPITFLAAWTGMFVKYFLSNYKVNKYMVVAASACAAATIACIFSRFGLTTTPQHPVFACVIALVPSVPLINSADDLLDGHTVVGLTRATVSLITVTSIAFGMIFPLKLMHMAMYDSIPISYNNIAVQSIAAMVLSAGYATMFNVPRRLVIFSAMGGAISIGIRNVLIYNFDFGLASSTFFGSFAVGIIAIYLIRGLRVPLKVVAVASLNPLIPGVLAYKSMMGIMSLGENAQLPELLKTVQSSITAAVVVVYIALGITIPNVLSRKRYAKRLDDLSKTYT